jgi:putative phosphoesterase
MRIAIFSDVHGNLTALEAVLADINRQTVDSIVFAGDLCFIGPRPSECLQLVRERGIASIYGNTDDWVLGRQQPPEARKASIRYQRSDNPADALHITHANPRDVNQIIFPPESEQVARYNQIRQPDSELEPLLVGLEAAVLVFGHLHIPSVRTWGNLRLAHISSVSIPGDNDPRAKYAIFTWKAGSWEMELRRVSYDMDAEVAAYQVMRPPGWKKFVETIINEGYFAQRV